MCSICKILGVAKYPFHQEVFRVVATRYAWPRSLSNTCDSGDQKGDSSMPEGEDGKKICKPCSNPCDYNPSTPTIYDSRKYGHCLPSNDVCPPFDRLPNIPTGIFRCTGGEKLGTGASKCGCYQCPEYFSYQHMTYYDMHLIMRGCRRPSPITGRKP